MKQIYDNKYLIYNEFYNPYLLNFVPAGSKVLDVGCNGGQFGKKLIADKGCSVFGVDISSNAIMEAKKHLDAARVMDIEQESLPFKDEKFDIIVFGDVLEHLVNPEKVLIDFKKNLSPNGKVLVSLPNVANISVRFRLLVGKWEYRPSGILDETHLRFYTLKSMKRLFAKCGFKIEEIVATPGFDFFIGRRISFLRTVTDKICLLFPKLLANQFVFRLADEAGYHEADQYI